MTKTYHLVVIPDDQQLLQLFRKLDDVAVWYDHYEYGLPIHDDKARERMAKAVQEWLEMLENLALKERSQ